MTRLEKITVWSSTVLVTATGIVYAVMKHLLAPADEWAVVNHPLQPWMLKLHILTAPVLVFGIGLLTTRHILPRLRWVAGPGRRTGTAAAWVVIPMILTGYLIQAVTHVLTAAVLGWVHLALGVIFALAAAGHAWSARRRTASLARRP